MRCSGYFCGAVLLASGAWAQPDAAFHKVPNETNAWHVLRASAETMGDGLAIHQESPAGNGFLLPRGAWPRRTMAAEADILMRQRLVASGWNFGGVTLYQDDANYWMLALVEGPGGVYTVDFLENQAGVWQAQNEAKTALKREGNVSFAWKPDTAYRLRLAFEDGRVTARVSDPADGRVLGSAFFVLEKMPAVRSGRPGVVVRASAVECRNFRFGMTVVPSADRRSAVALLDDALPGHDRAANARLAAALRKRGLAVTSLTAGQLLSETVLTADAFRVFIVPKCDALPAALGPLIQDYARGGGHLIFLGGPFLDRGMWQHGGGWLDKEGLQALLQAVTPAHRPFEIGPAHDTKAWRRSCQNGRTASAWRVLNEGPGGSSCFRLDISDLQGWDVRHSPEMERLFGEGDNFFTFMGKGDPKTTQLAVEIIERDGARWIASTPLTSEWQRVGLRLEEFRYWKDSGGAKGRGHDGDRLNPRLAVRVCFGLSASHTSAVGAGPHTIWLADIGTAPDPLLAAGVAPADLSGSLETVYPRYKVFPLQNACFGSDTAARACGGTVCAIPRTVGEGLRRDCRWRFVPLTSVMDQGAEIGGVSEWLLLHSRFPLDGTVIAGFGYSDPAVWSSPEIAARIADVAERITRGVMFEAAGTEEFAYWPGEEVRLGACVRSFSQKTEEREIMLQIKTVERVVWSETVKRSFAEGVSDVEFVWTSPKEPGEYLFIARLSGEHRDEIRHGFAVLDPTPAPKSACISARDGDFWRDGKKWYPVGVNFWPLYVSGMDSEDYSAGWLRDPYYSPSLVERDLVHLRELGINMVSIQTPPLKEYRNLLDFLRLCRKYDIHANLYLGQASPLAFNDAELKAYIEAARLPGNPTVFAYDTIWEPGNHVFRNDAARARWDDEWRAWIVERYGSVERAEKDWGFKARRDKTGRVISPADACFAEDGAWRGMMAAYRRFMDNLTSRYWGKAHRRLRELDPNHLVSFRQGNTLPYDFALSGPVKHIDFICPEGYAIRDTDEGEDAIGFITRYVDYATGGKPIVWSEFGQSVWDVVRMEPNQAAIGKQGHYSERFYRAALAAGADGTVPWWWVGGYRVGERSDFGIVGPDRSERPAARLIREYGPRLKTPREKAQPSAWFEFDRDAHAGGYWRAAFNEGAQAYRAAAKEGKTLGVRTAGTGTDSATVPLIAVGNVPCDGTNPPKYLDAEFNFLQVLNADGVWQEAEDGAEITVKAGQPVKARASVGNTQEATWRGDKSGHHPLRGVMLVTRAKEGAREVGVQPLPRDANWISADVPFLGDADFGEFELFKSAGQTVVMPVVMSVRMELHSRGPLIPFGEARVFTLKAKGP